MAKLTGANTFSALKINPAATAWGTAGSVGTGDLCQATYTPANGGSVIASSPIGTGRQLAVDSQLASNVYGFSLSGQASFQSGLDRVLAQFFGTAAAPTEQNVGEADYLHKFLLNTTWNTNYATYVVESSSTTVHEYKSAAFNSLTLSYGAPKNYLEWTAVATADDVTVASPTNNNAAVRAATLADSEKVLASPVDSFWINSDSGALDSGDLVNITSLQFTMNKPQSSKAEYKGSSGNGAPTGDDIVNAQLTVTINGAADNAYWLAWKAETEYKASFLVEGTQIGAGDNKHVSIYCPRLKLLNQPEDPRTANGINPLTLTFECLAASSAPSGMDSVYPYVTLLNERTTAYLS